MNNLPQEQEQKQEGTEEHEEHKEYKEREEQSSLFPTSIARVRAQTRTDKKTNKIDFFMLSVRTEGAQPLQPHFRRAPSFHEQTSWENIILPVPVAVQDECVSTLNLSNPQLTLLLIDEFKVVFRYFGYIEGTRSVCERSLCVLRISNALDRSLFHTDRYTAHLSIRCWRLFFATYDMKRIAILREHYFMKVFQGRQP